MSLGPQARRAYKQLYHLIIAGLLKPGTKLLSQAELARALGVSLLTMRQALAQLERDGLIVSHHGRGTFVEGRVPPAALILEDDPGQQMVLAEHVRRHGGRAVLASGPTAGVLALQQDPSIALVLCDVHMPMAEDGIWLIKIVQQLWPTVPLVALAASPEDLKPLWGQPAYPMLVLTKPVTEAHVARILEYALGRRQRPGGEPRQAPGRQAKGQSPAPR
jgi:CheY-like chemotaxis protein